MRQFAQPAPCVCLCAAYAVNLEGELFKDLMKGYNKKVRPVENSGDVTQVTLKMTLTNLISLVRTLLNGILMGIGTNDNAMTMNFSSQSEKDEALMTSVWIEMVICGTFLTYGGALRYG